MVLLVSVCVLVCKCVFGWFQGCDGVCVSVCVGGWVCEVGVHYDIISFEFRGLPSVRQGEIFVHEIISTTISTEARTQEA